MANLVRIAVFGPESTGKTSLTQALAEHFGEPWSPEFVREYWEKHGGRIEAKDLPAIARGQIAEEDKAAERAQRILFCDTELLTHVLWADLLYPGACEAWVREEAENRAKRFTLYLLCAIDLPFQPDPQRCFPDQAGREKCAQLWRETLEKRALPFVEIAVRA